MCCSWKEIFLDCRSHVIDVILAQLEGQSQNSYRSVLIFLDCIFNIKQQQTYHEQKKTTTKIPLTQSVYKENTNFRIIVIQAYVQTLQ